MNDIEELLRVRLRAEADQIAAAWRDAAVSVERRASTLARRRVVRTRAMRVSALVVVVAVVVGVGVVATTRHRVTSDQPASVIVTDAPPVTPYLPTYLPAGFTLEKATQFVNGGQQPPEQLEWYRIYRKIDSPMGSPTIVLSWTPSNEQQKGTPAGLHGDGLSRFEVRDGKSISYGGKGVTVDELLIAANSVVPVGDGYELHQLPVGWSLATSIDHFDGAVAGGLGATFTTAAGRKGPVISIGVQPMSSDQLDITAALPSEDATTTDPVRGKTTLAVRCGAKCDPPTNDATLWWEESPGVLVSVSGPGIAPDELRKVAESIGPIPAEQGLALVNKTSPPPVRIPVRGELEVPRYALTKPPTGWRKNHADTNTTPGQVPTAKTLRSTVYRSNDQGPTDPYLLVISGGDESYGVGADGVVLANGEHRSIGWAKDHRVFVVRGFKVPETEFVAIANELHDRGVAAAPPASVRGYTKTSESAGDAPRRYDSISFQNDTASVEFHNQTGSDIAELLDERLSDNASAEAVTVAGHDAALVDVSSVDAKRFWVLWAEPSGIVEIDIQGLAREQLGPLLDAVGMLGTDDYAALVASG